MEMFEQATRQKFRFSSARGELSVEQLWDVPLRSRDDFNLNALARGVNRDVGVASEENFVDTEKANPGQKLAESKLALIKHVIEVKKDEEEAAKIRAENKVKREKLLSIIAGKQDDKLSEMSLKELQKQADALQE